jgi:hypothetical protein
MAMLWTDHFGVQNPTGDHESTTMNYAKMVPRGTIAEPFWLPKWSRGLHGGNQKPTRDGPRRTISKKHQKQNFTNKNLNQHNLEGI